MPTFAPSRCKPLLLVLASITLTVSLLIVGLGLCAGQAPVLDVADPWQPTGGPNAPGGQTTALVVHPATPGTLYAAVGMGDNGLAGRIFASRDGAATWTPVYTGTSRLSALAVTAGSVVYAGADWAVQDQILKSADAGLHWAGVLDSEDGQSPTSFKALAVDPTNSDIVFAVGEQALDNENKAVVYRSQDAGAAWTRIFSSPSSCCGGRFNAVAIDPRDPRTVFVAGLGSDDNDNFGVIRRSTDGGVTWTQVYTETDDGKDGDITALLVHPLTPTIVYAGRGVGAHNDVYRSRDGGDTWEKVFDNAGKLLAFEPPNTIYAVYGSGDVYRSVAGGNPGSWTLMSKASKETEFSALAIGLAPTPHVLYAGTRGGALVASTDSGVTWQVRAAGITSLLHPRSIAVDPHDPHTLFVAGGGTRGFRSGDAGATWRSLESLPQAMRVFAIHPADPRIVLAGSATYEGPLLFRSADGGLGWSPVFTLSLLSNGQLNAIAFDPAVTATVYAAGWGSGPLATGGAILASADGGLHWAPVLYNPTENAGFYALAVNPRTRAVYAGGGEDQPGGKGPVGIVFRSDDLGLSWTRVLTASGPVRHIVVDYQQDGVVYAAASDDGNLYKSGDAGDHWALIRESPKAGMKTVLAIDPRLPSRLYLADWGYAGESVDGGLTWSAQNAPLGQGLPGMEVAALTVDAGSATQTLWAGVSGVWYLRRPAPQPGAAAILRVGYQDAPLPQAGGITWFSSWVLDRDENWVADGTPVTYTATGAGAFWPATLVVPTHDGVANAPLNRVRAGAATVTITAGSMVTTRTVTFIPWPAGVWLPMLPTGHR